MALLYLEARRLYRNQNKDEAAEIDRFMISVFLPEW